MMEENPHNIHHHDSHGNCRNMLGNLSEYIDGVLEQQLCTEIERHLQSCDNCRVVVDSLRKTVYLYQATTPSAAVPEAVRERLYHCLDLEEFLADHGCEEHSEV